MATTSVPLPPESKMLLERLVQERDAAQQRLDVAVLATKAALNIPADWLINRLDDGFIPPPTDGSSEN